MKEFNLNERSGVLGGISLSDVSPQDASPRLADRAYRILEELIVTLQLSPGSTWSESTICERIEIGRTPVREALQRLALEQLVQIVPRYGVIITEIVFPEQMMVVEMRRVLEPLIASRAARRSNVHEKIRIADYRAKLLETIASGNVLEYLRIHFIIRRYVASCTRNKFLASSLPPIDALSRRFFYAHQSQPEQLEKAGGMHADILHAIATDDEQAAIGAANKLMDHIEQFTREAFKTGY
jgi:DNA-binding GntR family transcriptional regulator